MTIELKLSNAYRASAATCRVGTHYLFGKVALFETPLKAPRSHFYQPPRLYQDTLKISDKCDTYSKCMKSDLSVANTMYYPNYF